MDDSPTLSSLVHTMEICNPSPEEQEIQSQFIESVPGLSEYGTGMVAAITHRAHEEISCFKKYIEEKAGVKKKAKVSIMLSDAELHSFQQNIRALENAIIGIMNLETKNDGYITFTLDEISRK